MFSFSTSALSVGVTIAETDPVATVQALINAAIATGATTITVTGSKITANSILSLTIPAGVTVVWNAVYKGIANPVIDYYGEGTLEIGGPDGWVQNTSTPNSYTAIRANGNRLVVSGGTVQSGRGRAIEGAGPGTVVSVTGGSVFNEATSNLFPVIDMTNASNIGSVIVNVSGGNVFAASVGATAYGYVIQSYGNIAVSGGTLSTSGGYGRVINLVGDSTNVTVSGGILEATGVAGTAISTSTTAPTQVTNTSVTITGGFVASYATGNGWAIHTTGSSSTVGISGGTVFAYGNSITGSSNSVIYTERNAGGFTATTGNGIVIAWNRPAWVAGGQGVYFTGYTTDIITSPAGVTATWGKRNPTANRLFDGIDYSFSGNTGFIQLQEVTVVDATYYADIVIQRGGGTAGNTVTTSGSGGSYTISNSQRVTIPYNGSQSFTVNSASGPPGYYISAVDTFDPNTGPSAMYFSDLLYAGTVTGDTFTDTVTLANVARNHVIRVQYVQTGLSTNYIISFAGLGGSFDSLGFNQVTPLTNKTFTVTAQSGFYINEVVVDGHPVTLSNTVNQPGTSNLQSGSYTFESISANHVITATFGHVDLNITATADTGGSISPQGNVVVPYGGGRTFTITPNEGYFIEKVLIDGISVNTTSVQEFLDVVGNHTIAVTFAQNAKPDVYDFSVIAGTGGTVSGTPNGYYEEGYAVSVAATANDGFHFTSWTITGADIDGGIYAKPATFNMPPNTVVLTADFEPNPPGTFTLNVIGGDRGTLTGTRSGAYTEGYAVEVTAIAYVGYRFIGWTITGADITGGSNMNPAGFLMPGNIVTITAIFEEIVEERPPQAASPQTGDSRNIAIPIVILAIGAILIVGAVLYRRSMKRKTK